MKSKRQENVIFLKQKSDQRKKICKSCMQNDYLKNNYHKLKSKSHRLYNPTYNHLNVRNSILKTQFYKIKKNFKLKSETMYLSVAIFDLATSMYLFEKKSFEKIFLTCVGLSVKVKESRQISSNFNSFQRFSFNSRIEISSYENKILTILGFDLNIITPFDLIHKILKKCCWFKNLSYKKMKQVNMILESICFETMLNYRTKKFNLIPISLGILMITKNALKMKDLIPKCFKKIFLLNENQLNLVYMFIYAIFKQKNKNL
jgi:hypothetical protein